MGHAKPHYLKIVNGEIVKVAKGFSADHAIDLLKGKKQPAGVIAIVIGQQDPEDIKKHLTNHFPIKE